MLTKFYKGMKPEHISQGFHGNHQALDIVNKYGTPLCAPEDCLVLGIRGDGFTPGDHTNTIHGYGVRLKGLETGYEYLFWHTLPYLPVHGGDRVKRGGIVAFMGNSGNVYTGGKYVPIEDRTKEPFMGTHLHIEVEQNVNGEMLRVNPLPLIQWLWEPQWTTKDWLAAWMVSLKKMATVLR